jgi:hypothetical protein
MITQDYLKQIFEYKNGELIWKLKISQKNNIGKVAGTKKIDLNNKYKIIGINGKNYTNHRLIFLYHNGYLPEEVDHIDGNPLNNNIENLRAASHGENQRNSKKRKNNSTGYKNVSYRKRDDIYSVSIRFNGIIKNIGVFKDLELADLVAQEARDKYHKEFARHL